MVLMFFLKIRLNLFHEDIGDYFGVHKSTVSSSNSTQYERNRWFRHLALALGWTANGAKLPRNFHHVLDIMAVKTANLIKWPDRETLQQTMAVGFWKFFKKFCVILDCSEVFVERPTDPHARAQMWSNYKHLSTIKILIGATPQGTIAYVSRCMGGCVSDQEIVEQSSLLNYLLAGKC